MWARVIKEECTPGNSRIYKLGEMLILKESALEHFYTLYTRDKDGQSIIDLIKKECVEIIP
ncbi:hypothetical protein [Clostridium sp. B9]|uniref:hypothetical protein n=1 Tax=Clostridium sp. B9 TaxID=3423224 RepID=UPI003D2F4209